MINVYLSAQIFWGNLSGTRTELVELVMTLAGGFRIVPHPGTIQQSDLKRAMACTPVIQDSCGTWPMKQKPGGSLSFHE